MRARIRTTSLALGGLLALTGVAACSEGTSDTERIQREGEGDLEGNPEGEAEESETEGQVGEGEGEGGGD